MKKPRPDEYAELYRPFIEPISYKKLIKGLKLEHTDTLTVLQNITDEEALFRYAADKWSIKELIGHIIDCERIYCFRALSIARDEPSPIAGFDQDAYVKTSHSDQRSMKSLLKELKFVRKATIALFKSFDEDMLGKTGTANGLKMSVNFLGYLVIGHEHHHVNMIKTKYLSVISPEK